MFRWLLLSALLHFTTLHAAPAPPPRSRPVTKASLVGLWRARWGNTSCALQFCENGAYLCDYAGQPFVGSWNLLPDGRLVIHEQPAASDCPESPEPIYFRRDAATAKWVSLLHSLTLLERIR